MIVKNNNMDNNSSLKLKQQQHSNTESHLKLTEGSKSPESPSSKKECGENSPLMDLRNINKYIYDLDAEDEGNQKVKDENKENVHNSNETSFDHADFECQPETHDNEHTLDLTNYQSKNQKWPNKSSKMNTESDNCQQQTTYNYTESAVSSRQYVNQISNSDMLCNNNFRNVDKTSIEEAATMRASANNSAPKMQAISSFNEESSSKKSETCLKISDLASGQKLIQDSIKNSSTPLEYRTSEIQNFMQKIEAQPQTSVFEIPEKSCEHTPT